MEHDLIIPNYHVILVHFPLGLLVAGTLIELFAFLWRRSAFRVAGRWMILIGALAAIPTATSGLVAARQALSDEQMASWSDLQKSTKIHSDAQWEALGDHVTLNAIAVGVFALLVVSWLGSSDRVRRSLHFAFLVVLLIGMGLLTAGAWHGGELVYRYATGLVAAPTTEPTTHPASLASVTHMSGPEIEKAVEHVIPPVQAHVIMAGWVVALALAALGLSIRQITMAPDPRGEEAVVDQQLADALTPGRPLASGSSFDFEKARASLLANADPAPALIPPARFWLIVIVLAMITVPLGWWTVGILDVNSAINYLKDFNRPRFHSILAGSIIVLGAILAIITRWASRSKPTVIFFAFLLVCALAAQAWLGILLLFDGNQGSLTHFGN